MPLDRTSSAHFLAPEMATGSLPRRPLGHLGTWPIIHKCALSLNNTGTNTPASLPASLPSSSHSRFYYKTTQS
ncbi:mCG147672 [Mus musculus]|nr:mCG147672 [Mus musculus]